MPDDPSYPPRSQPPGQAGWRRQYPDPYQHYGSYRQPYDWRYAPPQHTRPYATHQMPTPPVVSTHERKRSRAGVLFVGALALSMVSASIGGAAALMVRSPHSIISSLTTAPAN